MLDCAGVAMSEQDVAEYVRVAWVLVTAIVMVWAGRNV